MFTGLIEEIGKVIAIKKSSNSCELIIAASKILSDVNIGDSIAVNGICLTATGYTNSSFTVDVMSETLSRTSLSSLHSGSLVNLERAMSLGARFGGHIVSGHIDGTGKILSIKKESNAHWFKIAASNKILSFIVEKGSITIDGISLTVATVTDKTFEVSIIPHTLSQTILKNKKAGDIVNLENDIIGKYIQKFSNTASTTLSKGFLSKNGF